MQPIVMPAATAFSTFSIKASRSTRLPLPPHPAAVPGSGYLPEIWLLGSSLFSAQLQGASNLRILFTQIVPLCLPSVIIRLTLDMAGIILTAAGLGFLGLGAQPPTPEWGAMVSSGRQVLLDQWWVATIPGLAIFVVSLGFNLLGDGLRDASDSRTA